MKEFLVTTTGKKKTVIRASFYSLTSSNQSTRSSSRYTFHADVDGKLETVAEFNSNYVESIVDASFNVSIN